MASGDASCAGDTLEGRLLEQVRAYYVGGRESGQKQPAGTSLFAGVLIGWSVGMATGLVVGLVAGLFLDPLIHSTARTDAMARATSRPQTMVWRPA